MWVAVNIDWLLHCILSIINNMQHEQTCCPREESWVTLKMSALFITVLYWPHRPVCYDHSYIDIWLLLVKKMFRLRSTVILWFLYLWLVSFFFNCFHYLAAVALLPWSLVSFFCIFDEPFSWYPVLFSFYYCLCFSICGCVSLGVICCHIAFLFFSMLQCDGIQRLIKHLTHTIVYPQRVLVLVAFDVDALCACKILQVCCISWFNIQIIEKL